MAHQGRKTLNNSFVQVWELLFAAGIAALRTPSPYGHDFVAIAARVSRGDREGQQVIVNKKGGHTFARIYTCCWSHTTNCYGGGGTRIGGYSEALDRWAG